MFIKSKDPKTRNQIRWVKSSEQIKRENNDKASAELARRTPTSGRQVLLKAQPYGEPTK